MKKSVQLYAIRDLAKDNFEEALKVVSEIGYEGVEFAGFFNHPAFQVKEWLNKYNLSVSGAHVAPELIFDDTDATIAYHKTIGNTRIICPWYDVKTKADVVALADKLKAVLPKFKENGMVLGYHNHAHEFQKDGDEYLIDILAKEMEGTDFMLEFDVYWVYRGGENPVTYLKKYADRIDVFHAKDGIGDQGTTLGEGSVDMKAVFRFAKENNMDWAVVESEANEHAKEQVAAIRKDFEMLEQFMQG
ncbi:sugar phosphate isomerase/epimerase [Paludicola sp. MB14-C6]|uniref:sugar phosphate isomerase/epimerase family protein n=1 Tax=Paludihabitans sp. MB14-C6 TaxID=3070656 RepID=UPI0027DBCDD8|nr:sugar phosphate isomerase/epimerase [Paludicola sp. MB14-C6]WMJ21971.1 sugar phosphate isomerase/epimerase [Paludicola sp. MB14-C6]